MRLDAAYAGDRSLEEDDGVLAAARAEGRTVVTRDVALSNRAEESILLESRDVERQLAELADAGLVLTLADEPTRCGRCNGALERVHRSEPTPEYAPEPGQTPLWRCTACGQFFWKGSHWDRVERTLSRIGSASENGDASTSE